MQNHAQHYMSKCVLIDLMQYKLHSVSSGIPTGGSFNMTDASQLLFYWFCVYLGFFFN